MVRQIYPTELHVNKANYFYIEAPFLDLHLSVSNGTVSSKIYNKREDLRIWNINFPFVDGDVPRFPSCGIYLDAAYVLCKSVF